MRLSFLDRIAERLRKRRRSRPNPELAPPPYVELGRHSYGLFRANVFGATARSPVTVGSFCSFAPGVCLLAHVGHRTDLPSTFPFRTLLEWREMPGPEGCLNHDSVTRGPIVIGHDVWIGQNSAVLSGVTIGTGAVVGTAAVVTRDVPPYGVVAGSPARLIRYRFPPETIAELLATAWWELPDEALHRLEPHFYDPDIAAFVAAVRREREAGPR